MPARRLTPPSLRHDPPDSVARTEWLRAFWPAPIGVDWREQLRVVLGATLGILVTALLCHLIAGPVALSWPWLVGPMGASAILVFGVPASPMAQPWSVVAGNTLSTLVGIACVRWVGPPELAAAVAVGASIALMFALRCLHPAGGASALMVALTGVSDPSFALYPVLANSLLLVAAGIVYNNATRRAYPHMHLYSAAPAPRDGAAEAADADLDAVIAGYNQVLDISRDDLKAMLEDTRLRAYQRKLSNVRCGDIMSRRLITVGPATPLPQAWDLFREHRIKALPVVDGAGNMVGIVTPADFLHAAEIDTRDGFDVRLRKLRQWTGRTNVGEPEVVEQIMTRQVRVAKVDRHLAELIPLFGSTGHHHIPILGAGDRIVGIITLSDVVAALSRLDPLPAAP
ncbi:CBS-domain-containing membrane protein [Burkholderiales bacterium]|nr:CBS-domain-containing membrane protein [Burkholderiales bacterium]